MSDTVNAVIDELDRMQQMNLAAARGVCNESDLELEQYITEDEKLEVTVTVAGDGIVAYTGLRLENQAWASHAADIKIIDELVESGHLIRK